MPRLPDGIGLEISDETPEMTEGVFGQESGSCDSDGLARVAPSEVWPADRGESRCISDVPPSH
jgi:hypothetical protein